MNKKFIINEVIYYFDYETFNNYFKDIKRKKNVTFEKLEIALSEYLKISKEAIHNWRFGKQSPSTLEFIIEICKYFKIKDYMILLKRKEIVSNMNNFNQYQLNSIKLLYDKII